MIDDANSGYTGQSESYKKLEKSNCGQIGEKNQVLCFHSETSYGYEFTIIVRDFKISFLYLYTMTINSFYSKCWNVVKC